MYTPRKRLVSHIEGNYIWFIGRQILQYKSENLWKGHLERNPKAKMHPKKISNLTGSRLALGQKASVKCQKLASMWEKGSSWKLIKLDQGGKLSRFPEPAYDQAILFLNFCKTGMFWNCLSVNTKKCCYESRQTIGRIKGQRHPKQKSGKGGDSSRISNVCVIKKKKNS